MYLIDYSTDSIQQSQHSFNHKLERILKQESFRKEHECEFTLLTPREIEVFKLLMKDFNSKDVAQHLSISRYTVEQHRKNIHKKLNTHSILRLMNYALAFNLI